MLKLLPNLIIYSLFLRIYLFLKHWYFDGFIWFFNHLGQIIKNFDHFFAIKITYHNLLTPLHQDYSFISYILSIPTRFFLIISGLIFYSFLTFIFASLFVIWALIPLVALFMSIFELSNLNF